MLHGGETVRSPKYMPFSIRAAGNERVTPKATTGHAVPDRDAAECELNLSGSQLVVGCVFFLSAAKFLMWGLLKLWLFEG